MAGAGWVNSLFPEQVSSRWGSADQDVLGTNYRSLDLELRPDSEGALTATLVRRACLPDEEQPVRAVLYVHGFVDYFFQTHLADAWAAAGYTFYALDLRKHGRSLRPHHTPNFVTALADYDEELDAAVRIIRDEDGHSSLTVMGHSTGGLVVSLWANRRQCEAVIDAVVLNSPWFDLNAGLFMRTLGTSAVHALGRLAPMRRVGGLGPEYPRSIHQDFGGSWDYNLSWKPHEGFPVRAGWLSAVRRGHAQIARGLELDCPVFVAYAARSATSRSSRAEISSADVVLDVRHIAQGGPKLGNLVTCVRVAGGIHDLTLSAEPSRGRFFAELMRWQETYVPRR